MAIDRFYEEDLDNLRKRTIENAAIKHSWENLPDETYNMMTVYEKSDLTEAIVYNKVQIEKKFNEDSEKIEFKKIRDKDLTIEPLKLETPVDFSLIFSYKDKLRG